MSNTPSPTSRMLLSGFTLAAGTAASIACASAGQNGQMGILAAGAIINAISGLAGNTLASDVQSLLNRPVPDGDSRRWNHDILRASVLAISDIIKKQARQHNEATADTLFSLAQAVSTHYDKIDDDTPLAVVTEQEIRESLSTGDSFQKQPSGNPETWAAFLHLIARDIPHLPNLPNLPQPVIEELGTAICNGFNNQLFQVLKFDFDAQGSPLKGRAYAAISLDLLKHLAHGNQQILTAIQRLSPKIDSIKDDTALILEGNTEMRKMMEEILDRQSQNTPSRETLSPRQRFDLALAEIAAEKDIPEDRLRELLDLYAQRVGMEPHPTFEDKYNVLMLSQAQEEAAKIASNDAEAAIARMQQEQAIREKGLAIAEDARIREGAHRERAVSSYLKEGQAFKLILKYENALAAFRKAAALAPDSWEALHHLGLMCRTLAHWQEAESAYTAAIETSKGTQKELTSTINLAALFNITNRRPEAETLMRRSLAIAEVYFDGNHPEVANCLNNLAQLLHDTNRLAEAEPLMRRALAIDEKSLGNSHPNVAIRLNNLALLLQATNRVAEAEPLLRRALDIDEKSLGNSHPKVATRFNNLALLLQATKRLAEAEPLLRRALAISEDSLGENHPEVAVVLNNLARLLKDTKRLAEAEPLMRRALAIDENAFGEYHPKIATRLNNLALIFRETERSEEAEPLLRRAIAIVEASFGRNHPEAAISLNNLARLLQTSNRYDEAEQLMRRHLVIFIVFSKNTGHDHPNLKMGVQNYCVLLKEMKMKNPEYSEKLSTLSVEAGWERSEWVAKLKEILNGT